MIVLAILTMGFGEKDTTAPRVVKTFPLNGTQDVDPSVTEISVTFNEEMMEGGFSWAYENKEDFPIMTGQPYFTDNHTKNVLPVKLKPNKKYVIWINTKNTPYFKDKSGNVLEPFRFTFKTK